MKLRFSLNQRLLAALLLALLIIRITGLFFSNAQLYFDEAQYWAWAQDLSFGYFTKPPLLAWIIAGFTKLCGDAEPCLRLASPVLNTLTAALVYFLALRLYGNRVAFWSALAYVTLPVISLSSTVISTDVPLLLCFTGAMLALHHHIEKPRPITGILLGLSVGLGLNAKYAMAYFFLCTAIYLIFTPQARPILRKPSTGLALLLTALLIAPNIWWNRQHGFPTMHHVADNASWHGGIHILNAFEFFGSQFMVLGPVVFAVFLISLTGKEKTGKPQADRFLLSFSLPVILIIIFQALMSRAFANWAAVSFPAIAILATALLLRRPKFFVFSMSLQLVLAALLIIGGIFAADLRLPSGEFAYKRMQGWRETAAQVEAQALKEQMPLIAVDGRLMTAEMLYYLRDKNLEVRGAKIRGARPTDHFQLTRPWVYGDSAALLLTPQDPAAFGIPKNFATKVTTLPPRPFLSREPYALYLVKEAPGP